jgi:hypothetical protein
MIVGCKKHGNGNQATNRNAHRGNRQAKAQFAVQDFPPDEPS